MAMELPAEDVLRWIVGKYARLLAAHGAALAAPVLIQPTGDFFPDEFHADASGVRRLLQRMTSYAPIADDLPIELAFSAADAESGGCGSIACGTVEKLTTPAGRVDDLGDGYRVVVAAADVALPDVLAASLARAVGGLVLREAGETDTSDAAAELAAAACGFGVLLLNGAAVWAKSCGGLRMARGTALPVEVLAVAAALFAAVHALGESTSRAHLGPTQREAFDQAAAWTASNRGLVATLRDRPAVLDGRPFHIEPVRGPLGRWLHERKLERELRASPSPARPALSEQQKRRLDEARALVDEVLGTE